MLYLLLICYDPTAKRDPSDPPSFQPQHAALESEMKDEGIFVAGSALMPPEIAPPLRVRQGKTVSIDGPFTETRELIGGFYIVECKDAADAAQQAARIPVGSRAWVDVRQIGLFHADAGHISSMRGLA